MSAALALLWRPILLAITGIGLWLRGRQQARSAEKSRAAAGWRKTREKMDAAEILGDDPAAARRWLRERDPAQR